MTEHESEQKNATSTLKEIPLSEFEISLMRSQIIDYVVRVINMIENYWKFRYRDLLSVGLTVKTSSELYVEGNKIVWKLIVDIPEELIIDLARRKKMRMFKLPKPRPLTRQEMRLAEEKAKELEELLKESLEEKGYKCGPIKDKVEKLDSQINIIEPRLSEIDRTVRNMQSDMLAFKQIIDHVMILEQRLNSFERRLKNLEKSKR